MVLFIGNLKKNLFLDMDKLLLFFQAAYDRIWSRKEGYAQFACLTGKAKKKKLSRDTPSRS